MIANLDKGQQRIADLVASQLQPGEGVEAVLKTSQTGPSPWLISFISYLLLFFVRYYAIAVSNQRVFLVRLGWTGRPKIIEAVYPRQSVRVIEYKTGLWSVLRLDRPTDGELKLNVARMVRGSADAVVAALGGAPGAMTPRP